MTNGKKPTKAKKPNPVRNVRVDPAVWQAFKAQAVMHGQTLQQAFEDALREHWKEPK